MLNNTVPFCVATSSTAPETRPAQSAGVGEAPLTAPHPAILNAIYNACGVRILKVPALPEVVKKALTEKAAGQAGIVPARS